jgi:tetratricopeptide (TPR) repeat protein
MGKPTEAEGEFRKAIALSRKATDESPEVPRYRQFLSNHYMNLGAMLNQTGRPAEAEAEFRKVLELDPTNAGARNGVANAQRQAMFQEKLAAFLNGEFQPTTNDERLALAELCIGKKLYGRSADLFEAVFAADATLGEDRRAQRRYNAACSAALAATGQSKEEPPLDDAAKSRLRQLAIDWLKAELSAWQGLSTTNEKGNKNLVVDTLAHWKKDADLAGVRGEMELAKLPEAERHAWEAFWEDIEALLKRCRE